MVEKSKRGGKFSSDLGWYLVGHSARVLNGVEPVVLGNLFLGHVLSIHGLECEPCTFSQPIGGLTPSRGTNEIRFRVIYPSAGVTTQEFLVAVAAKLLGDRAGIGAKCFEGLDDAFKHERLHNVEPNVLGVAVNEKNGVAVTQVADCVTKNNSQVDLIEVLVSGSKVFSVGSLL